MSFRATTLKQASLVLFLLGLARVAVFGQAANSPVVFQNLDAITTSFVAPQSLSNISSGTANQWLKVEFHYSVNSPANGGFLDAVEFKVWIEGRDMFAADAPTAQGIAVGLTGSVTYVNVASNKDAYGVFYVHPSTLARYGTGSDPTSDFDRKFNIHIEAYVDGKKMDYFDKKKEQDPNWFQTLRAVPNLVYRQDQSPFILTDVDRYPAIKLPATP